MLKHYYKTALIFSFAALVAGWNTANAAELISAKLTTFNEVPTIAASGNGQIVLRINNARTTIRYSLIYKNLGETTTATQAHLHFAKPGENGDVFVFLCSNLGNGPDGTQACPDAGTELTGAIRSEDILGTGIDPGDIAEGDLKTVIRAIRNGAVYVNVHSDEFAGGHLRGQL
jgi:hypothetical protein